MTAKEMEDALRALAKELSMIASSLDVLKSEADWLARKIGPVDRVPIMDVDQSPLPFWRIAEDRRAA